MFTEQIESSRNRILSDYKNGRDIDKTDVFSLPRKAEIISLTDKLVRMVFPGYYRDGDNRFYNIDTVLAQLVEDIAFRLNKQIGIVLVNDDVLEHEKSTDGRSEEIVLQFLDRIPDIRAALDTDLEAFYEGDPAAYSKDEIIFSYPGMFAITVFRLAHELWDLGVPIIPRIMVEYAHNTTGIDIHPGATIGNYFMIDHGTGIVIGETTIIGDHVKIYQGVTLGGISTRGGQKLKLVKRHPTIGNRVTIYAGASILGGETVIGDDVVIGGNVFITHSVDAGTKVSIKNQELVYDDGKGKLVEQEADDENWFYVI